MSLGGLPHTNPSKAVELVLKYTPEIPTWPQLPGLGFKENMYTQFSQSIPGIRMEDERVWIELDDDSAVEAFYQKILDENLNHFSLAPEFASAFFEFERMMEGRPAKLIRGQLTGPISLALNLTDKNKRAMLYDDTYKEIITKTVNMTGRWMEKRLFKLGQGTLINLDEPYLVMFGSAFLNTSREEVLSTLQEAVSGLAGLSGVHCCGNTEWPLILNSPTNVLSFDAYNYYHTLSLYPEEVAAFLEKGGIIAWGVVPSTPEPFEAENLQSLIGRLENGIELLAGKGVETETIHRQSLVTPTCGLSGLSEKQSEAALGMTRDISSHMREKYGLED